MPCLAPGATRSTFPDAWQQGPATSFGTSTEEETCPHEATSPTATYPDASADSTYMTVRLPGWLTVDKLILVLTNERPAFQMPGITHITSTPRHRLRPHTSATSPSGPDPDDLRARPLSLPIPRRASFYVHCPLERKASSWCLPISLRRLP